MLDHLLSGFCVAYLLLKVCDVLVVINWCSIFVGLHVLCSVVIVATDCMLISIKFKQHVKHA